MYACMHVRVRAHVYVSMYLCVCMYVCVYACMHASTRNTQDAMTKTTSNLRRGMDHAIAT